MKMRVFWLSGFLAFFLCIAAAAQQAQTGAAPIYPVNAKYVQGTGPGYWPTNGGSLALNLAAGTANCAGTVVTYSGGTLAMTASTTNYVYLNTSASCAPAAKTTAFTSADIPIAVVVAGSSTITSIADDRTMFIETAFGSGLTGAAGGDLSGSYPNPAVAQINGAAVPASKTIVGTNSSGQLVDASSATLANSTTGNAATASALAATPSQCTSGQFATGVAASGNANCGTPAGGGGGGGGSALPSNAVLVFAGDSKNDDDSNAIEPTIALSSFTCASGTCTVVNTGTNGLSAGDQVNMRYSSAWTSAFSAPTDITLSTGYTLFKVLSGGLSSTGFTFSYAGTGSCSSTCGNAAKATFNLPFNVNGLTGLAASPNVVIPNPVTMQALNTDYTTVLHPLSEAVTSLPTYFILGDFEDDVAASSAGCNSAATIEAAMQSLWAKIHTDGSSVVIWSDTPFSYNQSGIGSCTSGYKIWIALQQWLPLQGKSAANMASGQYWDLFSDVGRVVNDPENTSLIAGNGGFTAGSVNLAAADIADVLRSGLSDPLDKRPTYYGAPASQSSAANGFMHVPAADAIYYEQWCAADFSVCPFIIGTYYSYRHITVNEDSASVFATTNSGGGGTSTLAVQDNGIYGSVYPRITSYGPNIGNATTTTWEFGHDTNSLNTAILTHYFASNGSTSNYMSLGIKGTTGIKLDGAGHLYVPDVATSPSTAPICPNGTGGAFTTSGCVAGSTFNVNSSPVSNPNLNATTPSADSGYTAATPKVSGSNVIVETPNYTGTSPIVVTGQAISCPTCGTSSGGTNVSLNSGSTVANLGINGFMPQACADTSGSGTAQSCTTGASFTPQADNCIVYTTTTANSGTGLTVNINSLGAESVAIAGASGWTTTLVASSSIPANKPMHLCYDGTNWDASGTGYAASGVTSTGWTTLSFNSTPTTTFPGCGSAEAYQSTISIPMSYGTALRIKASLVRPNTSTTMDVAVATAATGVGGYEIAAQTDKNQVLYYFNSSASATVITASGTTYAYDQALPTPLNLAVYPMSSTENYLLGSTMVATVNSGVAQSQSISGQNGTLDLGSSSVYVFVCAPSSAAGIVGAAYMLSPTPW